MGYLRQIIGIICEQMDVVMHPKFVNEFCDLVENTGIENRVGRKLLQRMETIRQVGLDNLCSSGNNNFERLKGDGQGLYSIHIKENNINLRILLSQDINGKLLLHTFFERSGKGNTDYTKHISIAISRRDDELQNRRK